MDLKTLSINNEAQEMRLLHPVSKADLDVSFMVVGADSPTFKKADREIARIRFMERQRRGGLKNLAQSFDFDQEEEDKVKRVAACITGWKNLDYDGKPLKYSPANAFKVLKEQPWILEQVAAFADDRANFIKG